MGSYHRPIARPGDCRPVGNIAIILSPPSLTGSPFDRLEKLYSLTECKLDYDYCQVNQFTLSLLRTTHQNDHSAKPLACHNLEQMYEPRPEPVSNGY